MTRLAEIEPETLSGDWRAAFDAADARGRMMMTPTLHAPELMGALHHFADVLKAKGTISHRLVEMLRLRIAFHNQCRSCMAMRYQSGIEGGITEGDVCSLETPEEAPDLTEAEKAALAYADISAINHFAIDDAIFARLREHFSEAEIVELGLHIAYFIGFGRLVAAWDMVEELPGGQVDKSAPATPWDSETFVVPDSEEPRNMIPALRNREYMQLCWVVTDLEAAMNHWIKTAGAGPFFVFGEVHFTESNYRGSPADIQPMRAAMGQFGGTQIELVQPTGDDPGIWTDLFPFGKGGFHHTGLYCADYEAQRDAYVAAGCEVAFEGLMMGAKTCYIDTSPTLGFMTELVTANPVAEGVFGAIRAASDGWDGKDPIRTLGG